MREMDLFDFFPQTGKSSHGPSIRRMQSLLILKVSQVGDDATHEKSMNFHSRQIVQITRVYFSIGCNLCSLDLFSAFASASDSDSRDLEERFIASRLLLLFNLRKNDFAVSRPFWRDQASFPTQIKLNEPKMTRKVKKSQPQMENS